MATCVPIPDSKPFYRQSDLLKLFGISRQTLYAWRLAEDNRFPAAIRLAPGNLLVWRAQDVQVWLDTRPSA